MKKLFIPVIFVMLFISLVSAVYIEDNRTINNMDHAIRIQEINTIPREMIPGNSAVIGIKIKNSAKLHLDDVRIKLVLPGGFGFLDDVNQIKISRLESEDSKNVFFNVISSPSIGEGIYDASLIVNYVSYLGTNYANVGEDKQDNYTFGLVVKGIPNILAQIEKSEIYRGNDIGVVTIKFINNGVGNVKFLTAELLDSKNYDIVSSKINYVGDLDSDDFESIDFRIKLKKEKTTDLLLKIDYKDSLNEEYSKEFKLPLEIRNAKELGIKTNGTSTAIIIIIVIAIIAYFVYKKYKKKKKIDII